VGSWTGTSGRVCVNHLSITITKYQRLSIYKEKRFVLEIPVQDRVSPLQLPLTFWWSPPVASALPFQSVFYWGPHPMLAPSCGPLLRALSPPYSLHLGSGLCPQILRVHPGMVVPNSHIRSQEEEEEMGVSLPGRQKSHWLPNVRGTS
jgi:hypothetical protein